MAKDRPFLCRVFCSFFLDTENWKLELEMENYVEFIKMPSYFQVFHFSGCFFFLFFSVVKARRIYNKHIVQMQSSSRCVPSSYKNKQESLRGSLSVILCLEKCILHWQITKCWLIYDCWGIKHFPIYGKYTEKCIRSKILIVYVTWPSSIDAWKK